MNIVLVEPEIPPNTGNIARLCAATNSKLHLVSPLRFRLDDSILKRAGMYYWQQVHWHLWNNWAAFTKALPVGAGCWFVEKVGKMRYDEAEFNPDDYLVFGRETAGLPPALLKNNPESCLRIPMYNAETRSLNLANCVALVLYESLRQQQFSGEFSD